MDKDKTSSDPNEHKAGDNSAENLAWSFDTQKARELYDMGMRDVELMSQLDTTKGEVAAWRKENGLAANRTIIWNEKRARALHDAGATDQQIAADLSEAGGNVNVSAVATWRRKNKLDPNPVGMWFPQQDKTGNSGTVQEGPKEKRAAPPVETPDVEGGTRRGHLVALPSAPRTPEEPPSPTGMPKRGLHQRKRNKADMPLPTMFARPMPSMDLFENFGGMGLSESGGIPEQEAIYMLATILHLCRLDYGWDNEEIAEFISAAQFTEQILYNLAAQTGTMDSIDTFFDFDDYDDLGFDLGFMEIPKPKKQQNKKNKTSDKKNGKSGPKKSGGAKNGGSKNSGGGRGRSKNNKNKE